jgi:tetratricopeptide (TPR) repeat protein
MKQKNKNKPKKRIDPIDEAEKKTRGKRLLKKACVAGLFGCLGVLILLIGSGIITKTNIFGTKTDLEAAGYFELIQRFDRLLGGIDDGLPINPEYLKSLIAVLENKAVGAEATLSVLKRYRELAKKNNVFSADYAKSIERAAEKFPHSALISALEAETLVRQNNLLDDGAKKKLWRSALVLTENGPLSESAFFPLVFCIHALCGSFGDIEATQKVKRADDIFASFIRSIHSDQSEKNEASARLREEMIVDAALLRIAQQDQTAAAIVLTPLDYQTLVLENTQRFMAEYSYDFGNPMLGAELWMRLGSERDLVRAADAFVLAGTIQNARRLWTISITKRSNAIDDPDTKRLRAQSLYNLASTSSDNAEKRRYLQDLFIELEGIENRGDKNKAPLALIYGTIMWSRLMDDQFATSFLEDNPLTQYNGVVYLELFRRRINAISIQKSLADTWLLLDMFPSDPAVYTWAAWYFEFQRTPDEIEGLRHFAGQNNVSVPALELSAALSSMRGQKLGAAATILQNIEGKNEFENWTVPANLGLIYDARHEYRAALAEYQKAAELININQNSAQQDDEQPSGEQESNEQQSGEQQNSVASKNKTARVYLHIARCFGILGNKLEQGRAIERAVEAAPDDINVRVAMKQHERLQTSIGTGRDR